MSPIRQFKQFRLWLEHGSELAILRLRMLKLDLTEQLLSWIKIGIALMVAGRFLGPRRPDAQKLSPYECGFEAFEDARMKFDVRYYLIAIQFIVFDLEIIFIVPWTLVFQELGPRALVTMGLFVGMLFLGFVYVWKKGALEWE